MAITKKCPMHCEHCFEWNALNKPDVLSLEDIRTMVRRFYDLGTGQIQLTGGEPMTRLDDMLEIIRTSPRDIEFWVLSSGALFTPTNARRLKEAGLTGVVISLDHYDRDAHNTFRGHPQAYDWALRAVRAANEVGLVTALSLCATRSFISEANLMAYADMARRMGVSFIQVLEPRAEGHYAGKDVELHPDQLKLLDAFFEMMNTDPAYADYPIVNYHGYVQHRYGCLLSGDRSIYVDTDGDMLACPFCRTKGGSALADNYKETLERIRTSGCHLFGHAELEHVAATEEAY
jgi:MoaA/NifB/PqqE/SkfB family radical SAM enzyme